MIKYSEIINRFKKKSSSSSSKAIKTSELSVAGYGYMKRRLGLLSYEANELLEARRTEHAKNS